MHLVTWRRLAQSQEGLISRRQLGALGHDKDFVRTQLRAERWQEVGPVVIATTTGRLTREQLMWAGVLHAGPRAAVGGLTALELKGLRNWHRDDVMVLVDKSHNLQPIAGIDFVETRRPLRCLSRRRTSPGLARRARRSPVRWLRAGHAYGVRAALRRGPAGTDHARPPRRVGPAHAAAAPGQAVPARPGRDRRRRSLDVRARRAPGCVASIGCRCRPVRCGAATRPAASASPTRMATGRRSRGRARGRRRLPHGRGALGRRHRT